MTIFDAAFAFFLPVCSFNCRPRVRFTPPLYFCFFLSSLFPYFERPDSNIDLSFVTGKETAPLAHYHQRDATVRHACCRTEGLLTTLVEINTCVPLETSGPFANGGGRLSSHRSEPWETLSDVWLSLVKVVWLVVTKTFVGCVAAKETRYTGVHWSLRCLFSSAKQSRCHHCGSSPGMTKQTLSPVRPADD